MFKKAEVERLEAAGFVIDDDIARADGCVVTITPIGRDGMSTTTITTPDGAILRLEFQHQKMN